MYIYVILRPLDSYPNKTNSTQHAGSHISHREKKTDYSQALTCRLNVDVLIISLFSLELPYPRGQTNVWELQKRKEFKCVQPILVLQKKYPPINQKKQHNEDASLFNIVGSCVSMNLCVNKNVCLPIWRE